MDIKVNETILLPKNMLLTPLGATILANKKQLAVSQYVVLSINGERVVIKKKFGKSIKHDTYISKVIELQRICFDYSK